MDGHCRVLIYIQRNAFLNKFLESFGLDRQAEVTDRQFHEEVSSLLIAGYRTRETCFPLDGRYLSVRNGGGARIRDRALLDRGDLLR